MRFGVVGTYGSVAQVVAMAAEAEDAGWDGFFTWDALSIGAMDIWDPWTLLGAAATATRRIRLGALVFALPRRPPWEVARQAVTVDHLSGGRLVMPVGLGVLEDRGFAGVGAGSPSTRVRAEMLDECLAVLERAWTGETFSFTGRHHTVTDLVIAPPPVQRPRVPVWPVAALGSARSLGRAARWDGAVLQHAGHDALVRPEEAAVAVRWLHERRARLAADGTGVGTGVGTTPVTTFDVVAQGALPPDADQAREYLAALAAAGVTWWVEARWDPATDSPEALGALIRRGPPVT